MGKLIVFNMVTVDGFFEGPNKEIDWHNVDAEFIEFAIEQLESAGALLFGRITYELMANFWPTKEAIKNDPIVADKMNTLPKFVFSKTLQKVDWNNARLIKINIPEEIAKLRQETEKDLLILGSGRLTVALTKLGLIDEYRLMVDPVILGKGKSLFEGLDKRINLALIKTKTYNSGNVLLCYSFT